MNSTRKNGLVVSALSLFAVMLSACDGVDAQAPTNDPAPAAAEESFDVITAVRGADGQMRKNTVRMTESQWKQIVEQRNRLLDPNQASPKGDPSVFQTQQATTLVDSCANLASTWFFSGPNQTGTRTCLIDWWTDDNTPSQVYDVGYAIHSYNLGNFRGQNVICTGTSDCNVYTCRQGSSVWFNAGNCGGSVGCTGYVSSTPPPYTARYVHMQNGFFNCW
jgi:hypothetical protein